MDIKHEPPFMVEDDDYNSIMKFRLVTNNLNICADLVTSLLGEKIGEGAHRDVYEFGLDPENYVVKVGREDGQANMIEFYIYQEICGLKLDKEWVKDWFAPVLWISPNGRILVMQRTRQCPEKPRPTKIPSAFHDVKTANFGWIGDKFVCHDYGDIYGFIQYKKIFKKVDWSY